MQNCCEVKEKRGQKIGKKRSFVFINMKIRKRQLRTRILYYNEVQNTPDKLLTLSSQENPHDILLIKQG
jgi:hypothetical protein